MRKYLLNPEELTKTSEDINEFQKDLEELWEKWYVLNHFFWKKWEITSYWSITIKTKIKPDLAKLLDIYKLEPNLILKDLEWTYNVVFYLEKWISKNDYLRAGKWLEFILDWDLIDYYFYENYKIIIEHKNDNIDKELINFLTQLSLQLTSDVRLERIFTQNNYEELLKTNKIPFSELFEALKLPLIDIDIEKNFHIKYWKPFNFLENYFDSQRKTFSFLNEKFELNFDIDDKKISKYSKEWILIENWWNFYSNKKWYYTLNKDWDAKVITDFKIKVYYKIRKTDWSMIYIVSLYNEESWFESEKIEWCNDTGKTQFSNYIQKYWDFHFFWLDSDIKNLHKKIASTNTIPYIKSIVWYGYQDEDQIIVFKNWIWDLKEKVFTPKQDQYFFNYNFQWYLVTNNRWEDIMDRKIDWIPEFNTDKIVDLNDILTFLTSLYKDDSWHLMFYYMCGSLWYLLYWSQYEPFPFFFAKWITSSWKTTFNELMMKMWWVENKWWLDFANCSTFTMSFMLSHLIKFPYYIWEYRRNTPWASQKEWIIRSAFDRKTQQKWRADQSIVNYNFYANLIMDWEEVFTDWAVRSRIIQKRFISWHRITWNFNDLVKQWQWILKYMMYSYFTNSDKTKWNEWYKKWKEIFHPICQKINSRIWDNYAMVYAWCYCIFWDNDKVLQVLKDSCEFQLEDFEKDWTSMQIIKAISKFLENSYFSYNSLEIWDKCIVIKWNKLDEYIKKYRVELSLDVETYKEHVEALWYEVWYYDTWTSMAYWIIIPNNNIPKEFLLNPDFYAAKKKYDLANPF